MTSWPAIIKYAQDDELAYIADLAQWNDDRDLHAIEYERMDILIDSLGLIHHLNSRDDVCVQPESTGDIIELEDAISLVKAHFSMIGACCSAKLTARSVAELVSLVGFDDNGI
jgi:cell division FtsZ-interacting protein ZapD